MITSVGNTVVQDMKRIQQAKYRRERGEFFIEGEHLIQEAHKAGILDHVLITEKYELVGDVIYNGIKEVVTLASDIPCDYVTNIVAGQITRTRTPQGIFGIAKMKENSPQGTEQKILVLDGIQDPGNLGTIIRSAQAFGIEAILMTEDCVDIYNDKVLRATQGVTFFMKIARLPLETIHALLQQSMVPIFALDLEGTPITAQANLAAFALIIGNEGNGIRTQNWSSCAPSKVTIPMEAHIESLNVAIATSITLYELHRGTISK